MTVQQGYKAEDSKYAEQLEKVWIKKIEGIRWKFIVKPSGYTSLYKEQIGSKDKKYFASQLKAINIESAFQYIYQYHKLTEPIKSLNDLEDA